MKKLLNFLTLCSALIIAAGPALASPPQIPTAAIADNAVTSAKMSAVGTAGTYGDTTHIPVFTTDPAGRVTGVTLALIGSGVPLGTAYQVPHMNSAGTAFVTDSGLLDDGTNTTVAGTLGVGGMTTLHGAVIYGAALANTIEATSGYNINTSTPIIGNAYPTLAFDATGTFTTSRFYDILRATGYQSSDGTAGATTTLDDGSTIKNGLVVSAPSILLEPALGNPAANGYLLSSTTAGVRSWVVPPSAGTTYTFTAPLVNTTGTVSASVMGASGASHAAGIVPDPGGTAGTSRYLREDGTFSVPPGAAGFTPAAVSAPSSVTGYIHSYTSTTAYAAFQALFTADVSGEGGGDTEWQYSTDNATWKGPDGTSTTYYFSKGTTWLCPYGFGSGSVYARAYNVNASGSVSAATASSAVAYVTPSVTGFVSVSNSLPVPSASLRGQQVLLSGQPVTGSAYYNAITSISSLKNWWRLWDASGSAAHDSWGSLNGTYGTGLSYQQTGPTLDSGEHSVTSSSSSTYVNTVTNASATIASGTGLTVIAWINFLGSSTGGSGYTGVGYGSGSYANFGLGITQTGGTTYTVYGETSGTGSVSYAVSNTGWHMVVFTMTSTASALYVDGISRSTSTTGASETSSTDPLYIGKSSTRAIGFSEVAVFNTALTATQISNLYNVTTAQNDHLYCCYELSGGTYAWQLIF